MNNTINAFNRGAITYDLTIGRLTNYQAAYDALIEELPSGGRVLDLACGPGNISAYLLSKKPLEIWGWDLSPQMLILAREKIPQGKFEERSIVQFETNEKFDGIINGFGFPFLTSEEVLTSLESSAKALKPQGVIYISFMEGKKDGWEVPSFCPDTPVYFHYHSKDKIVDSLKSLGLEILQDWQFDYQESDGSVTKDQVLIFRNK